jgi:hypothetical protein
MQPVKYCSKYITFKIEIYHGDFDNNWLFADLLCIDDSLHLLKLYALKNYVQYTQYPLSIPIIGTIVSKIISSTGKTNWNSINLSDSYRK